MSESPRASKSDVARVTQEGATSPGRCSPSKAPKIKNLHERITALEHKVTALLGLPLHEDEDKLKKLGAAARDITFLLQCEFATGHFRSTLLQLVEKMCNQTRHPLMVESFVKFKLVPMLVTWMDESGPNGSVMAKCQEATLKVIRSLSLVTVGRARLVQSAAVSKLVHLIRSDNNEVSCCALRATFNLSVVDVYIRKEIVRAGALPLLLAAAVQMSDNGRVTSRRCAAIGTLANLATETDIKRAIVKDYDGLTPLLELLGSQDESILTHACRALFAIAANDENKIAIADAGGLPKLLGCMSWPSESVRMNAAGALANLAIHPVNKLRLVQFGALSKLRELAYSPNQKIMRQVARCFFALAAHVENRQSIIQEDCMKALVRLLLSDSNDVQLNAAGAIGNIAMTDEYKADVVDSGALDRLVFLARTTSTKVQRQAARAIFTLTARDVAKTRLAELDGLPGLIHLTQSSHPEIQRDAAGALANMAIGTSHKREIVTLGGLRPLVHLLQSSNVAVQRQSARAIFALAGTPKNQVCIIREGGLKPLIDLLSSKNDEVQKHACGAIANISNRHHPDVVQSPGALHQLVSIVLEHPGIEVRRQAARAVYNLSLPGKQRMHMMLSPYAGVTGEQQRMRHDMRALFHQTAQSQLNGHHYSLPPSLGSSGGTAPVPVRQSPNAPTAAAAAASGEASKKRSFEAFASAHQVRQRSLGSANTFNKSSRNAISAYSQHQKNKSAHRSRLRKYASSSCESQNSFEHDLHLVLPIPVGGTAALMRECPVPTPAADVVSQYAETASSSSAGAAVIVDASSASSQHKQKPFGLGGGPPRIHSRRYSAHSTLSTTDGDRLMDFSFSAELEEASQAATASACAAADEETSSAEVIGEDNNAPAGSVVYMDFFCHAPILTARWPMLARMVNQQLERAARLERGGSTDSGDAAGPCNNDSGDLYIRLPDHMAHRPTVWCSFLEYLYTDSVRVHALPLREDVRLASELAELALTCGMPRLCCFCLEINERLETVNPEIRKLKVEEFRSSTWVADMSKLLKSNDWLNFLDAKLPSPHDSGDVEFIPEAGDDDNDDANESIPEPPALQAQPILADDGNDNLMQQKRRKRVKRGCDASAKPPLMWPSPAASASVKRMRAHKVILASRCSYFKAQFGTGAAWKDHASETVRFSGSASALRVVLRYIYCGIDASVYRALKGDASLALQVLVIANEYNLDGLQLQCESILISRVDKENVFVLLEELELVHAPLLRSMCVNYVLANQSHFDGDDSVWDEKAGLFFKELQETARRWGFEFTLKAPVQAPEPSADESTMVLAPGMHRRGSSSSSLDVKNEGVAFKTSSEPIGFL